MIQTIKMNYCFDLEGWTIKDDIQDCRQIGS